VRVLVTGGSGFIGSHVVDRLLAAGIEPRILDLVPSPYHGATNVDTVVGDLLDPGALSRAMEGCDAVIHLAAAADVGAVEEAPVDAERTNARGTLAVLEAALAAGVGRVVYGSTIWVYGESGEGAIDEDAPLGLPRHIYTASKLAGEMYCSSYSELYGLDVTILRFGIPYGPRSRPSAVIPIFVRKALAGEPLTIAGDGSQTRRFVYVEDLAEGIVRALDTRAANRVFNLSSGETVTIRDLAEAVQEHVGTAEIVHVPGRRADFAGAEISSRRAERELGWQPSMRLREGIGKYVAWLKASGSPAPATESQATLSIARRVRDRMFADVPLSAVATLACTMFAFLLAHRMDEFDVRQADSVGVTTLFASVICLLLLSLPSAAAGRLFRQRALLSGWLVTGYVSLLTVPWPIATPPIAVPEIQTLVLSAIWTGAAVGIVTATTRWRDASQPASDHST
jgi:UDP-glucose 4-epimerase